MEMIRLEMMRFSGSEEVFSGFPEFAESTLANRHSPLLRSTLESQAGVLRVSAAELEQVNPEMARYDHRPEFVEVYSTDTGLLCLELIARDPRVVRAADGSAEQHPADYLLSLYALGSEGSTSDLRELAKAIEEHFEIEFESFKYRNRQFEQLGAEREHPAKPDNTEEESARLLVDRAVRKAAIAIAESGGLLIQDLPKHLGDASADAAAVETKLRQSPLVEADLAVSCKSRSTQVARAPSRKALEEMAENGLRCACGKDVTEEKIDEALTLTDHGRQMLRGSYWMTVLVILELLDLGVELDQMLVEIDSGGDEMDFFVDINGDLVLMELKDKDFSIGNAYSFGSKTGIYQARHPLVITTAYVGNDAKEHFAKAASARRASAPSFGEQETAGDTEYIEGLDNLRTGLQELISRIHETDAVQILGRMLPAVAITSRTLVSALRTKVRDSEQEELEISSDPDHRPECEPMEPSAPANPA